MGFDLRISAADYARLRAHLLRDDYDEHGAIVLAGCSGRGRLTLLARELHLLKDADFPPGLHGYRQFSPLRTAELAGRAGEEGLAYVAIHSHPRSGDRTGLSRDDLDSHRRLFPHLLDLTMGEPVAGIALGEECAAGEAWLPDLQPLQLERIIVPGPSLRRLQPEPEIGEGWASERHDRQARLFGNEGQQILRGLRVGVIGAGGGGSMIIEQLVHLGVGSVTVIDYDVVKTHNLSRIVGARRADAEAKMKKVEVAKRLAEAIDPSVDVVAIDGDIADLPTAERLLDLDFLFLATDTATARLVFNAIVHAYLIPGIQIGAKVEVAEGDEIEQIYVALRPVLPDHGCLQCNGLIDSMQLQREARSMEEAQAQDYIGAGEVIDPSVISLNGITASHAVNTMLFHAVGLFGEEELDYQLFFPLSQDSKSVGVRRDPECPFSGSGIGSLYARGGPASRLPCRPGTPAAMKDTDKNERSRLRRTVRYLRERLR